MVDIPILTSTADTIHMPEVTIIMTIRLEVEEAVQVFQPSAEVDREVEVDEVELLFRILWPLQLELFHDGEVLKGLRCFPEVDLIAEEVEDGGVVQHPPNRLEEALAAPLVFQLHLELDGKNPAAKKLLVRILLIIYRFLINF